MTDIFDQSYHEQPLDDQAFWEKTRRSLSCLDLYRVTWRQSLLSTDGHHLVCWFDSPDAESTRLALRQAGSHEVAPWAGTVHDAPSPPAPPPEAANVVVERSFDAPVTLDEIQSIEDAGASCLEMRRVEFARTIFSRDQKRMICLYRAPDAEAVREAQREANMPFDAIWSFELKT